MNDLLEKISSYNIFNYLLPGTLFSVAASELSSYSFVQDDIFLGLFFYYFVGLVISRLGSLLLQPALIWARFLKFSQYENYLDACKEDEKLDVLSSENNMYRTLTSMFLCLMLILGFEKLASIWPVFGIWGPFLGVVLLALLFAFSWRKQTNSINIRVEHHGNGSS